MDFSAWAISHSMELARGMGFGNALHLRINGNFVSDLLLLQIMDTIPRSRMEPQCYRWTIDTIL